jgi:hypothetical protein
VVQTNTFSVIYIYQNYITPGFTVFHLGDFVNKHESFPPTQERKGGVEESGNKPSIETIAAA